MARKQQRIAPPLARDEILAAWLQSRRDHNGTCDEQREEFLAILRKKHEVKKP